MFLEHQICRMISEDHVNLNVKEIYFQNIKSTSNVLAVYTQTHTHLQVFDSPAFSSLHLYHSAPVLHEKLPNSIKDLIIANNKDNLYSIFC